MNGWGLAGLAPVGGSGPSLAGGGGSGMLASRTALISVRPAGGRSQGSFAGQPHPKCVCGGLIGGGAGWWEGPWADWDGGGGVGHGEELWVVGWLALPLNGVEGADWGQSWEGPWLIRVVGTHRGWDWLGGGAAGDWLAVPTPYWGRGNNEGWGQPWRGVEGGGK